MAVSLVIQPNSGLHFVTAARVAAELVMRVQRTPLHQATILNVNVPDVPYEALKGYQATRLGFRHRSERIVRMEDPRGRPVYWVGPSGSSADAGPGTDFHAVANNYVSVTPLQIDLTRHTMLDDVRQWLQGREA
jgi:5'-nucleotidase